MDPSQPRDADLSAIEAIAALASWSPWKPFAEAAATAPLTPGVYLARQVTTGQLVYSGCAGERKGRGLRGRLAVYASGKGATTGLGEAAMDRALADPDWIRAQLAALEHDGPARTTIWAQRAMARARLELSFATCPDGPAARALELKVIGILHGQPLWNRRR